MREKDKSWLNKPYYFNDDKQFQLVISFGLGFVTFLFLVLLRPGNATEFDIKINPYAFRLVYGIISTTVLLFYFFVFTKRFPKYYKNETWTIGKHLFNIFCVMLTCGILNAVYSKYVLTDDFFHRNTGYLGILIQSITYGVFPTIIYIYFDEKNRLKKVTKATKNVMDAKKNKRSNRLPLNNNKKVTIVATNKKDKLSFRLSSLLYITSDTNYACFFIRDKNGLLKEYILRVPLKVVQTHLEGFENIIRCHKSYIINSNYVKKISGNARGLYLHIKDLDNPIPVSRKFSQEQLENFISL